MEILAWLQNHWLELLTATGVPGIFLTAYALLKDGRARENANAIALNGQHAVLMRELYTNPELGRVLSSDADIRESPISLAEKMWLTSKILHAGTSFQAMRDSEMIDLEGFQRDVRDFFSLPIPKAIWESIRPYQNRSFVDFIDASLGDSKVIH